MKIKTNTWHYRWWRWTYGDNYLPDQTNLCSYVQRIFWITLGHVFIYVLLVFAILLLVGFVGLLEYQGWRYHTMGTAIGHGSVVVSIGLLALYAATTDANYDREPTLVGKWISAKKQGVCPLIEFEEPES